MMNQRTDPAVVAGSGVLGFGALALLAYASVGSVPPLTYGIIGNWYTKSVDLVDVYEGGRHLIGPWNYFMLFPSVVQTVEFTNEIGLMQSGVRYPKLHTRTKDGLVLYLQVSLQFRLIKETVGKLYAEFNIDYEQVFVSEIRDILIKAAADYEAVQLWKQRANVTDRMQRMVNEGLQRTYAECWGLQLMVIDLPKGFEDSIVKTQVWEQRVSTRQFEQEATRIRAHTTVIAAEYAKQARVIRAHGEANYTYTTKAAGATAKKHTLEIEAKILASIRERLELNDADLVQYQQYSAVKVMENASVFYGFGNQDTNVLISSALPPAPSPVRETSVTATWQVEFESAYCEEREDLGDVDSVRGCAQATRSNEVCGSYFITNAPSGSQCACVASGHDCNRRDSSKGNTVYKFPGPALSLGGRRLERPVAEGGPVAEELEL